MTSLFSHSLLNDTDRDVRGAYKAFSLAKVHAALPGKDNNDRSSANVKPPRKNFSVAAKEMAKTQSLEASFRNLSDYLSLIKRARDTIQGVAEKLTSLDNTVSEAAGLIDSDDYNSVSVGAIADARISGLAAGSGTFSSLSPIVTSGSGSGAVFTIRANGSGAYEIINIDADGSGYAIDDSITIAGTAIGGSSSRNDATLTITATSSLSETTTSLEAATDNIDRLALQLEAETVVRDISDIINESEFWDEDIFGGLRAIGYAQVGHTAAEQTLIDIQELSTSAIGSYLNAYFVNGSFAATSDLEGSYIDETQPETVGTLASLYGWNIQLKQVALGPSAAGSDAANGLISSTIGGFQTPTDVTPTPQNADSPAQVSRGDDYLPNGGSFSYSIAGDSLQLITDNLQVNGGDVIHGPYLISQNPVTLNTGDQLSFSWRGEVTDNAFDAYAYLLNADTGSTIELLDSTSNSTTSWSTVTHTVAADASYYFVFVAGSFDYDFTGTATAVSASGNSPVNGAIAASVTGTAALNINANNVSQSSTTGSGSGATFNLSSDNAGNYNVPSILTFGSGYALGDQITISGSDLGGVNTLNDATLTLTSVGATSISNVPQASTSGSGSGATFTISIDGTGNYRVNSISSGGSGYEPGDTITLSGSDLGGTTPSHDLTLNVDNIEAVSGAILHVDNISIDRSAEPQTVIAGIDISTQSAASDAANVISDAIKQIKYRDSYLASKEIALQNSINTISTQTTSSDLLITDLTVQQNLRQLKKIDVVDALMSDVHKARYLVSSGLLQLI
jgi:hypothetical protein